MYQFIWILIAGKTEQDHLAILEKILSGLQNAGTRLKRSKFAFMLSSIDYLGHRISADGLQPTKEKVRAISEAPAPLNVTQLRSFLGVVNYYSKFLPNLSTMLVPFYKLLRKQTTLYHPATNGLAERAVQILNNLLKKSEPGDINKQLARLLFH